MQVQKSTVVSIRYKMRNAKGEVLGDPIQYRSVDYVHGSGTIVPYLEEPLEGSGVNENKIFAVNLNNKEFTFEVFIDNIRWATADEIQTGHPGKEQCDCDGEC